jgi:hypothetical protein
MPSKKISLHPDYLNIAEVKQKEIVSTTAVFCGLRNPKSFELIIDFVTTPLMNRDLLVFCND